jgi:FecR protein
MKNARISWLRIGWSRPCRTKLWLALVVAFVTVLGLEARGQQAPQQTRAARLSSVDGQVQLSQGSQVMTSQAMDNAPLFEGTQATTSEDGRAEIQFDDGSVARITPNSSATLTTLRQQNGFPETSVTLNSGLAYFEIQSSTQPNSFRVRFGDSTVSPQGFTILRVNLDNPPGEVAVFSGNAHVDGANGLAVDMHGGETMKLNADTAGNYTVSEAIEPDSWDSWNSDRDQALTAQEAQRTEATNNVPNSSNPAWSDLNSNGNWYNLPGQGYVWSPYEAENPGWEPYGCGNWMWTPQYGYVWVSCESWGYMPYAYGSWNYYDGFGWGWAPVYGSYYPWWYGGIYVININRAPYLYKPPVRPRGGPVKPSGANPVHVAGGKYQPYPVVAVNRINGNAPAAPVHTRNGPVTVAGNTVVPLRAATPRAGYMSGGSGTTGVANGFGFSQGANSNVSRPIYGINTGSQGIIARPPTYYGNTYYGNAYSRPITPSRPMAPSGSYYAPRPVYSAPAPSRPAGGGAAPQMSGGGGAPHAGGGGAGPHK